MKRWTASVPNFNLIRWKKTVHQWWEPARSQPGSGNGLGPGMACGGRGHRCSHAIALGSGEQGCCCGRRQGAATWPLPEQRSPPCTRLWGQPRHCFTWALAHPHSKPCSFIQMARVVWGSSYSPKAPNPFMKYSLLAPKVCNVLYRLCSQ